MVVAGRSNAGGVDIGATAGSSVAANVQSVNAVSNGICNGVAVTGDVGILKPKPDVVEMPMPMPMPMPMTMPISSANAGTGAAGAAEATAANAGADAAST